MKIANKISLLIMFLLAVLIANTVIGLQQLSKIGRELRDVANEDVVLTGIISAVRQHQLEKAVLFERMIRVAEEIGFESITEGRKEHLLSYAGLTKREFDKLTELGALKIIEGRQLINEATARTRILDAKKDLLYAEALLQRIEKAHIHYDSVIGEIFVLINTGSFQLSFEDLDRIQKNETGLSRELKSLLKEVHGFTIKSLQRADRLEDVAQEALWLSLVISIVVAAVVAFLIIRGISRPLQNLAKAAEQIGKRDFVVTLDTSSRDEIGEVSSAFNTMSEQLLAFKSQLEKKNELLAKNLKTTEHQKKELEKINKELDSFTYTVSHDIGAPLMGISWYGKYLKEHYTDTFDKKGKQALLGICKGAERLSTLIKDLLSLTRISRIKNPYEKVALNDLVDSIRERLEFNIKAFNVSLKVQDKMPAIICDRIKLGEVFLNLVNNAIKFSSKDSSKRPVVEIGYHDKGNFHELHVKDNGIGIDPKFHAEVFDIFRRLNTSDQYEGSGAGLSIVKRVIDDHGGKIWVESGEGEGAVFLFTIPKNLKAARSSVSAGDPGGSKAV